MLKPAVIAMLLSSLAAAAAPAAADGPPLPNRAVDRLDLQRYSGQWHEIAHLPMFFQRQCVDSITATYTPAPDGTITVRNACRKADGTMDASIGAARSVPGKPGQLEVRFAPRWLSWLPMVWADYWVLDVDPDYQWAVVGGPGTRYLWILSRTPTMQREVFTRLRADALRRGYPVEKLVMAAELE